MHPILRIFVYQMVASLSYSGSCDSIGASVAKVGAVETALTCEQYAVRT